MDLNNNVVSTPRFSGSIPEQYDRLLAPLFFEPYAIEISRRIDPASLQLALELSCGTGCVTRHLRATLPPAVTLIASDVSADMLAVAKEKLKNEAIDWRFIDAQELPFADNSVDVIACSFGYMFVPDKPKAFKEANRVLKPGGQLIFTTWDKLELNKASNVYRKLIKQVLTESLPEVYGLPFSMYDSQAIKEWLEGAGFSKTIIEGVEKISVCPSVREAANGLVKGSSLYNEIMKQDPALVEQIIQRLEKELAAQFGTAPMKASMQAIISQAWK